MLTPIRIWVLLLFGAGLPLRAHALMGLAEYGSVHRYNDLATIHWSHPEDGCSSGGTYCFRLLDHDGEGFPGLPDLQQINVPPHGPTSWILGRGETDGDWFVYDLAARAFVVRGGALEAAEATWVAHGLGTPQFADSLNVGDFFSQTLGSRVDDLGRALLLATLFVLGLVIRFWPASVGVGALAVVFGFVALRRHRGHHL